MPKHPKAPPTLSPPAPDPDEALDAGADTETSPSGADPDRVTLRNVVSYELLEQVNPALLLALLQRYRASLEPLGVCLDDVAPSAGWLAALHEVLQRVDLDPGLQQALIDIGEMATEEGHEHTLQNARRAQLELFEDDRHLSTVDTAFTIYLEHRVLFSTSQSSLHAMQAESFVVYCARDTSPLVGLDGSRMMRFKSHLSGYFARRNRTGYCDVHVSESDEEISLVIVHGRPPRTFGVIRDSTTRSRDSHVQEKHDVLLFHRETCRLSIHATFAHEQDHYRRLFGKIFFGAYEHFSARTILSAEPLLALGVKALSTAGLPGIRRVKLRQIQVNEDGGEGARWTIEGPDLASRLENEDVMDTLQKGDIRLVRLDVMLSNQRKAVRVQLTPPNRLVHDRRVGPDQVRAFLIERGFMVLTPLVGVTRPTGLQ